LEAAGKEETDRFTNRPQTIKKCQKHTDPRGCFFSALYSTVNFTTLSHLHSGESKTLKTTPRSTYPRRAIRYLIALPSDA
jgi:hypothetical protein